MDRIPFNVPPLTGRELDYLREVLAGRRLAGNADFTARCRAWFIEWLGAKEALITHSCTGALEMSAILADIGAGDEVIMPSFTFVSTANAVVLRGGVPVFVDIRPDTLNIDERLIEAAITPRTKAIYVVHYAGVCAEMDTVLDIAKRHSLVVVEDAAQGLSSSYRGRPAGSFGTFSCFSFHETKNISSGEGGALIVNDAAFSERAFVIWEKGTNRRAFKLGLVDKYTWTDIGSSYLPSEFIAAVLLAQLERVEDITAARLQSWNLYHRAFAGLEQVGKLRRPIVPEHCQHNGHIYYLLLASQTERDRLLQALASDGIVAPFHYIPLHSSPAGQEFGRVSGALLVTEDLSGRLLRLPLFADLAASEIGRVVERVQLHLS